MTGWETYWSKVASKPIGTAPNVDLASGTPSIGHGRGEQRPG